MNLESYSPNSQTEINNQESNKGDLKKKLDHIEIEDEFTYISSSTSIKRSKLDKDDENELRNEEEIQIVTTHSRNDYEFELNSNSSRATTTTTNENTHTDIACCSVATTSNNPDQATSSSKVDDSSNPTSRQILSNLLPQLDPAKIPDHLDEMELCRILFQCANDGIDISAVVQSQFFQSLFLPQREKLDSVNTIEQCVDLISNSKNIIVLTGAGCSVSCGIPDFRSRDGVYARLRVDFPDLPDPQAMFDIMYFEHDPRPFFKFAKEIYPGQFKPSLSHLFVKKIEENGRLLRNYTQNIDTLEMTAQIKNVIQCHGSFATATCTICKYKVDSEFIREDIFAQQIPYCPKCKQLQESKMTLETNDPNLLVQKATVDISNSSEEDDEDFMPKFNRQNFTNVGILKPDIVFFGEGLPEHYHRSIELDKLKCDLLIVIGSSLKVKPVANIPHLLKPDVPQILINRESLKHLNFDIELLGDCDVIVNELLLRLDEKRLSDETQWSDICLNKQKLEMVENLESEKILFGETPTSAANANANEIVCLNEKSMTRDYLKENSFLNLKPNLYVFHGAELSIRAIRKKLRSMRKRMNLIDLNDLASSENSNDSEHARGGAINALFDDDDECDDSDDDDESDEFTSSDSNSSSESDEEEQNQENHDDNTPGSNIDENEREMKNEGDNCTN